MSTYICDLCGHEFPLVTSPLREEMEYDRAFAPEDRAGERVRVCDDCYRVAMKWWNALTPAEQEQVRQEYGP